MAPFIRILLRYLTFPLLTMGWILPEEQAAIIADPDLVSYVSAGLGVLASFIAEGWYALGRKWGWKR